MALKKTKISVASGSKHEFDLSCDHQTSMNFLLAQPVYYRHIPRGEHFNAKTLGTIRPAPMATPTFGRVRNNLRCFFVPYRLIWSQYDAARADVLGYSFANASIPQETPYIDASTIQQYFLTVQVDGGNLVEAVPSATSVKDADFHYGHVYYNYTPAGRRRLKLLRCLGYEPLWGSSKGFKYDALALLSYGQVYLDWYANSQYLDSSAVVALRKALSNNNPLSPTVLNLALFTDFMELVFAVVYDSDEYFNSAWDVPVAPTVSQSSTPIINDIAVVTPGNEAYVGVDANGTPIMYPSAGNGTQIGTQYLHDMLQALSNYQRRHALSGAREIDRALSDYGFVSDYASLRRAVYIGNRSIDIQIGDVFSTADITHSGVSGLGDYAGRGFGQGEGEFDFTADEDGMIIIVSTLIPSGGIVQGYDRNNRHLTKFDFYDPNFEVGVQVLEKGEVFVSPDDAFLDSGIEDYSLKFGYTGRFAEYKRPRSWWTSENRCVSAQAGGDSWNLFRLFSEESFNDSVLDVVHSLNFTRGLDWETFNRIFNYVLSDRDKFECFYHHEVHCQSPMKPLFDTYDFKEMHKTIKMDINGSKLN